MSEENRELVNFESRRDELSVMMARLDERIATLTTREEFINLYDTAEAFAWMGLNMQARLAASMADRGFERPERVNVQIWDRMVRIGRAQLLPELYAKHEGKPSFWWNRVKLLSIEDQRRLLKGETFKLVARGEGDEPDHVEIDIGALYATKDDRTTLELLIGPEGLRDVKAQNALLNSAEAAKFAQVSGAKAVPASFYVDKHRRKLVVTGPVELGLEELTDLAAQLGRLAK
jgi:hypothetical protein